ncbi:ERAP1 C domain containing protein [Asbolus verrucosus]|uniref:ERAP1 C domain containing protein n=1 Tax=Asbolus verrucosus TaxID=1661398 RepID=A0A482V974_ASBVE|nr:ERAP1 C domain containing protein [Asbolus verrucosus]
MIAHVMGLEQFQRGIQQYLQINKFNNTCSKDLWNSLKNFTSLNNFEDFVKNWTFQPGYPVLHVKANGQNIIITQERFLLHGTNKTKWHIPITYTTSNIEQKFTNTTTQIWFSPNNTELILKNKIIRYYRVKYDENLLRRIHSVLKTAPTNIHVLNRAQIVDDLFNFAIAEKISFAEVFDIISFLSEDVDYYPWYSAFNGFATTLQKISDQNIQKKLSVEYLWYLICDLY